MNRKEQIAEETEQWIGTPFHHQGRAKKIGVDCIGLIVGVCKNLELKSSCHDATNNRPILLHEFDNPNYSSLPNKHQLKDNLGELFFTIEEKDLDVGDVILFTLINWPQHVGIVTRVTAEDIFFVHSSEPVGKTILSRFDKRWKRQSVGFYRFPELVKEGDV